MYVKRNTEACSCNHCSCGEAIITYSKCVSVALVIQQAKRMRRFTLLSVAVWLYLFFYFIS